MNTKVSASAMCSCNALYMLYHEGKVQLEKDELNGLGIEKRNNELGASERVKGARGAILASGLY